MKKYVVYTHTNNLNNEVFYVGKGSYGGKVGYDRPVESGNTRRNEKWHNYVNEINHNYSIKIVAEFKDEKQALDYEKELQEFYWSIGQAKCSLLHGEEWDKNMRVVYCNPERNKKISNKLKGRSKSAECKEKISNTLKGVYCRANNPNKRRVYQYLPDGTFVKEYESVADGARAVGGCTSHICKVCNGKGKTHKGYVWSFSKCQ